MTESEESKSVEEQPSQPPDNRQRRSSGPGWLALLIAIVALGAAAWLWFSPAMVAPPEDTENWQARIPGIEERMDAMATELHGLAGALEQTERALESDRSEREHLASRLGARLDDIEGSQQSLHVQLDGLAASSDLEALEGRIDSLAGRLDELSGRLEDVSGRIVEVAELSSAEREQAHRQLMRRLRLMEIVGLLRLGQDRLDLAADVEGAREAFERAAQALTELDDPALAAARRQLADELESLRGLDKPDTVALGAQLRGIAGELHQWPGRQDPTAPDIEPVDSDEPGWRARLGTTLGRLITVRERAQAGPTPLEMDLAREQLALRLVAAELALARASESELDAQIDAIRLLIDTHFASDHSLVAAALARLDRLAEQARWPALPELGRARMMIAEELDRRP